MVPPGEVRGRRATGSPSHVDCINTQMIALGANNDALRQHEEQLQTAEPGLDAALVEGATAREADDQLLRLDEGAANDNAVARAAAFEKQLADAREVRYQLALRSPSKVLVDNKYPTDVPDGFPVGPHANWDDGVEGVCYNVRRWAGDIGTGGGGFIVQKDSGQKATSKTGERKTLVCQHHKKPSEQLAASGKAKIGSNCKWRVTFELCTSGWVLKHGCFEHSGHELMQTNAELMATAGGREFPEALIPWGEMMTKAGMSASHMMQAFAVWALEHNGGEVTWTYRDVYDRFKPTAESKVLDATNMMTKLEQRVRAREFAHVVARARRLPLRTRCALPLG